MKKLMLPKQHGTWVMVVLPYLLGVVVGNPSWIHLPLFIGWLFLYISLEPMMMFMKKKKKRDVYIKWFIAYFGIALVFLVAPLMFYPVLYLFAGFLILVLVVNMFYAKRKRERAFLNDLCGIMGLCLGGPAAYLVGTEQWDNTAYIIWIASILFFLGSVFFVKMFIREKNNPKFKWYSWFYHGFLLILSFVSGFTSLGVAYLFSFFRAVVFYKRPLKPKHTAMIEFINSAYFLIVMMIWLV